MVYYNSWLSTHMQFLTFGTKFKCDSCGEEFKTESESELKEHSKKEHK